MKLPFLLTLMAASVLLKPAVALAQPGHQQPGQPHHTANSPVVPDKLTPYRDGRVFPSRRTPSLIPPQRDETHPFTPDEAWPKTPDTGQLLPPSLKPDSRDDSTDKIFLNDEQDESAGSIKLP